MKAYNDYMNKISVSDTLHRRFVTCAESAGPVRRLPVARRYAVAFGGLAVLLLGILTMSWLGGNNAAPTGNNPTVSLPGASVQPGKTEEFALIFNKADNRTSATDIMISGRFWQELTADELQKVFPGLMDSHVITATANFRSDETGAALVHIDAHAVSAGGLTTNIQIAPGEVVVDYELSGDTKSTDVLGTAVTAGYFETEPNSKGQRNAICFASFNLSGLGYYAELGGNESDSAALREEFTSLIGRLIKGGAADLGIFDNPVIPQLREDRLDLNAAYADPDFGSYIPHGIPSGFAFESSLRFINQRDNYLSALWVKGMGDIHWRVSLFRENDRARLTSVADTQNYDLALYPIPRADSVPDELREIVDNPIFRSDELTLEAVRARAYEVSDAGDTSGPRMRFSVLYGEVLAEVNVKGATPEEIYIMLKEIGSH